MSISYIRQDYFHLGRQRQFNLALDIEILFTLWTDTADELISSIIISVIANFHLGLEAEVR